VFAELGMKAPGGQAVGRCTQFVRKYFLAGQKLEAGQVAALASLPEDASLLQRILVNHRRLIGFLSPLPLSPPSRYPHPCYIL
jgi:hypothetical protein